MGTIFLVLVRTLAAVFSETITDDIKIFKPTEK